MALVVPLEFWPRVIHEYPDKIGHPGRDETIDAVRRLYYWPAMIKQIKTHVRHCLICALTKRGGVLQSHSSLHPRPPTRPWQVVAFDVMDPYPTSREKNRYLLGCTDTFSKWVEIQASPAIDVNAMLRFLTNTFSRWGYPERIITDNAAQFRSLSWQRYLRRHDITGYTTPVYHQRANPVERRNQEIKKALRIPATQPGAPTDFDNLTKFAFANFISGARAAAVMSRREMGHPLPHGSSRGQQSRQDGDATPPTGLQRHPASLKRGEDT
ncbi:hypothetical protein NQ314_019391 [Rhamnusium bicolor]|uniref:RNA-directed DNA polymerase n=1 Tax=Rhamnusium bicolor TaxID=1586634 RepID=A0AAV8WPJ2_9CUCU|nr:hypothetical protein NQ314_019391 [Rhamnusium bicolor]